MLSKHIPIPIIHSVVKHSPWHLLSVAQVSAPAQWVLFVHPVSPLLHGERLHSTQQQNKFVARLSICDMLYRLPLHIPSDPHTEVPLHFLLWSHGPSLILQGVTAVHS